jgi:hypothetical protein
MLETPKALNIFAALLTTLQKVSQCISKKFKYVTMDNQQETFV